MTRDSERTAGHDEPGEDYEVFGPIDAGALREIRDLFVEMEPLVETATLDDPFDPQTLSVELSDGISSERGEDEHREFDSGRDTATARFDVRWSLTGNYAFHYTDDRDDNFRFDSHPKPDAPTRHFHPPPDAPSRPVEPSCITVSPVTLVTRAVLQRWRYAYDRGTFDGINDAENPP